jgi:bifunctional oligoribonuclease and PAP phosphatase NrnA
MLSEISNKLALFPTQEVERLHQKLSVCGEIVITTHTNPDGDAIGSSIALALMLQKMGKIARVIVPNAFDNYLSWLPGIADVIDAAAKPAEAAALVAAADLIFCLDFSAMRRCGDVETYIQASTAERVLIDHHLDPEDFAQYNFHVAGLSSTAELVYRLVVQLGVGAMIDQAVAENIYVGLMTDTGSFRFSTTTPEVHLIAAELLAQGIDVGRIHNLIYDNFSEKRTRFLGFMLYKKLHVLPEYHTAYMTVTRAEGQRFDLGTGDTEGLVNYALSLKGINFGVLLKASDRGTKLSFRSIGKFPCNEFAANFNGGGHYNASGGKVDLNIDETEAKFLKLLEQYKDALDY